MKPVSYPEFASVSFKMRCNCLCECLGMMFVKQLLTILLFCSFARVDGDLRCTEDFCSDYMDTNGCPSLPEVCNGTKIGVDYFQSPTVCNCCKTCLIHLGENETCAQGNAGAPTTQYICGPGLICTKGTGQDHATCKQMNTACTKLQKAYDDRRKNGQLWLTEVRPQCDARGRFTPARCIQGSICYCVSPIGERIFGEQAYTSTSLLNTMTCGCSLAAWTAQQLLGYVSTVHCLANGSYDPLQCIGEKCLCVNSTASPVDSNTAHPLFISNATLSCFDPQLHTEGMFERECEQQRAEALGRRELLQLEDVVAVGVQIPDCTPDGKYHRVQVRGHTKSCVDPEGNKLEDFAVDVGSSNATGMDCNCARTRWVLRQAGFTELPACTANGNFQPVQCYRGKCFCVDNNGNQQASEVDARSASTLTCQ